jgi:hypothetical protein
VEDQILDCQHKLERIDGLSASLGRDALLWEGRGREVEKSHNAVLGDALLISGFVALLGAFGAEERARLVGVWGEYLRKQKVAFTNDTVDYEDPGYEESGSEHPGRDWCLTSVVSAHSTVLLHELEFRGVASARDRFSCENGIIIEQATQRWPLLLDPHGCGLRYLRRKHCRLFQAPRPKAGGDDINLESYDAAEASIAARANPEKYLLSDEFAEKAKKLMECLRRAGQRIILPQD